MPSESSALAEALLLAVERASPPELHGWSASAAAGVREKPDRRSLTAVFAAAARRLRGVRLTAGLEGAGEALPGLPGRTGLPADLVFRVALLLLACEGLSPGQQAELVGGLFRTGDNQERCAVLTALAILPAPEAHRETAVEACRTNVREVFEAIACDNEYPARWFSDAQFNQMVMKAVFSGIPLARVRGLELRLNAELRRMADDYAAERRAAGRPVPADLALVETGRARS